MALLRELSCDGGANKSGRARDKDLHRASSSLCQKSSAAVHNSCNDLRLSHPATRSGFSEPRRSKGGRRQSLPESETKLQDFLPREIQGQVPMAERCCRAHASRLIGGRPSSVATVSVVTAL